MGARYIVIEAPEAALDCRVATERVSAGSSNLQASRARGRLMVALRV